MTDEKWQKVREIFDSALRRPAQERRRFVHEACGDDKTMRAEVESLLSSHDGAESFMETPAVAKVAQVIEATKKLETGKCFGHYEVVEQIGEGGMGEVYLAKDKKLDRKVAIKILNEEFSRHESNLTRFIREAKAASGLNHPNILVVHEIGEYENTNYIVSEFIEGKTLRQLLKEKPLTLPEVLDISIPIADALCTAHASNIIHRDIKPENIMVRPDGVVKVLDFGLAKLVLQKDRSIFGLEESTVQLSQTAKNVIVGTVSYMSPEQARAQRVDARTDIFSFGILLYEMLTGQQPFTGETVSHTIVAILEKEPPPVSQFINNYPPEIERIIKKCLAKKADERYRSAKSLLDDLKELKDELAFQSKLERSSAPNKKTEAETQIIRAAVTGKTQKRNSIAVLPFTNISAEAENEYFCDGLAEELLNALAKIEDLKVVARTSAFSFKNKNVEISEIGKTLNVKTVLEGSVRRSGNRLRISVQLINVADGYHLWSERYDREMRDIFDVQDEITLAVVDALKVKLFGEEKAAILKRYTDNTEAYELYLKGLYHCNKWTDEGIQKSIEYFEKALEKDPEFAPAYAKIADYYHFSSHIGLFSPQEILPKWKAAAQRALEIDEGLADAHLAMAHIYFYYERDWAKAEREFERAVELNPNSTDAHKYYGLFLASRERFAQAVTEGKKALALDPLSIAVNIVGGFIYLFVDRLDDALGLVGQMIELDSNAPQGYWVGGSLLMANGEYEEAVEAFQKSLSLGDNQMALAKLGCAYALAGRRDEALTILDKLIEMRGLHYTAPFNIARVYAGLGDNDHAFEWMEKAIEERDADLVFLKRYVEAGAGLYFGQNFSTNSRYQDILRRAGLPTDKIALRQATDETNVAHTTSSAEYIFRKIKHHKRGFLAVLTILLLSVMGLGYWLYSNRAASTSTKQIKSIAVLPFENRGGNPDLDYLSDGISEDVIDRLSQFPQLKVISRSSSFRYRGPDQNLQQIAATLGVDAIVTGRVISRGDSYQIRVDLTDASDNKQLWGSNFTRAITDAQLLHSDISREIVENLSLRLSGSQANAADLGTNNPQAYEAFAKGRYFLNKAGPDNLKRATEHFEQAVLFDPNYARAYAQLAFTYAWVVGRNTDPQEVRVKSKAAALRAVELAPNLPDAHFALGRVRFIHWEWAETEREWKRAIELNRNFARAHSEYATFLSMMGRDEESLAEANRAIELDPLDYISAVILLHTYWHMRRHDDTIEAGKKALALDPNFGFTHLMLAGGYMGKGMYKEAIAQYQEGIRVSGGDDPSNEALLGVAYAKMGERAKAEAILAKLRSRSDSVRSTRVNLAVLYDSLGMRDEAFAVIEKAYDERYEHLGYIRAYPEFDALREDPRFQDLMRRMGLPPTETKRTAG